jgi:hypothetical protein
MTSSAPADLAALQGEFAYPVQFEAGRNGILFSNADLTFTLPQAHISAHSEGEQLCERLCTEISHSSGSGLWALGSGLWALAPGLSGLSGSHLAFGQVDPDLPDATFSNGREILRLGQQEAAAPEWVSNPRAGELVDVHAETKLGYGNAFYQLIFLSELGG